MKKLNKFKTISVIRISKSTYKFINDIELSPLTFVNNRDSGMRLQMIRPVSRINYIRFRIGTSNMLLNSEHFESILQGKILHRLGAADYQFLHNVDEEIMEIEIYGFS